jgi:hypothetical protein
MLSLSKHCHAEPVEALSKRIPATGVVPANSLFLPIIHIKHVLINVDF